MIVLLLAIGLAIGSFLSALTFRLPRRQTIVKGRSQCPKCFREILWQDNIPLFSYLVLGGRCRACKAKISVRYPLIEFSTGVGFLGIYILLKNCHELFVQPICTWKENLGLLTLPYLLIVLSIMLAVFIIDYERKIIPDELSFTGFTLVFLTGILFMPSFYSLVASGFIVSTLLLLVHLVTGGRGMGLGDVKLALFGGIFLGWPYALIWIFIAFLTGAVVGIILILAGRVSFGKQIPFGPFLVVSFFITQVAGDAFIKLFFM